MATAPFDFDEGAPANNAIVSAFPAVERTFREAVEDALAIEHDLGDLSTNKTARHTFGRGSTATRNAVANWPLGAIWFNTDFSPVRLQQVSNATGPVWEDIGGAPAGFGFLPVGAMLDYIGVTAPTGFLLADGRTIGDASSGATSRANADTEELFKLLWDWPSTSVDIFTSTGAVSSKGASAAADFAAHKRITLPDRRGRVSAGQDDMGGTSANRLIGPGINGDSLGAVGGAQYSQLTATELPAHTHTGTTVSAGLHTHTVGFASGAAGGTVSPAGSLSTVAFTNPTSSDGAHTHTFTTNSTGSGAKFETMPPVIIMNVIVKY